jgi:hypothetical protein
MPKAQLEVDRNNDIIISFNDTIEIETIEQTDLKIRIFGSNLFYEFSWNAFFEDSDTVRIDTQIFSRILGNNNEQIVVEFINTNRFKSSYSHRGVNPEELSGFLFPSSGNDGSSGSLGQTAMIIFL